MAGEGKLLTLFLVFLRQLRDRDHVVALLELNQAYTLRGTTEDSEVLHGKAEDRSSAPAGCVPRQECTWSLRCRS